MNDPMNPLNPFYLMQERQEMKDLSPEEQHEYAVTSALCGCGSVALAFVLGLLLCALFSGCAVPKTVTVERVTHDTVQVTRLQRDSIFLRDSIYVRERTQGDTVFLEVTRWHTQYRDRWHHDSILIARRDSIPVPYPVDRLVEKQLSWWQQMQIWLGRLVLVALAVLAGWSVLRWWLRLKKVI